MRNFFENLRNFFTFKRKTGKTSTFLKIILAQFENIFQNCTCFYDILGPFLYTKLSVENLAAHNKLLLEGLPKKKQ